MDMDMDALELANEEWWIRVEEIAWWILMVLALPVGMFVTVNVTKLYRAHLRPLLAHLTGADPTTTTATTTAARRPAITPDVFRIGDPIPDGWDPGVTEEIRRNLAWGDAHYGRRTPPTAPAPSAPASTRPVRFLSRLAAALRALFVRGSSFVFRWIVLPLLVAVATVALYKMLRARLWPRARALGARLRADAVYAWHSETVYQWCEAAGRGVQRAGTVVWWTGVGMAGVTFVVVVFNIGDLRQETGRSVFSRGRVPPPPPPPVVGRYPDWARQFDIKREAFERGEEVQFFVGRDPAFRSRGDGVRRETPLDDSVDVLRPVPRYARDGHDDHDLHRDQDDIDVDTAPLSPGACETDTMTAAAPERPLPPAVTTSGEASAGEKLRLEDPYADGDGSTERRPKVFGEGWGDPELVGSWELPQPEPPRLVHEARGPGYYGWCGLCAMTHCCSVGVPVKT